MICSCGKEYEHEYGKCNLCKDCLLVYHRATQARYRLKHRRPPKPKLPRICKVCGKPASTRVARLLCDDCFRAYQREISHMHKVDKEWINEELNVLDEDIREQMIEIQRIRVKDEEAYLRGVGLNPNKHSGDDDLAARYEE